MTKEVASIKNALANHGYNNDGASKAAFHAAGKKLLKALANALGLKTGSYDLRSNQAGPASLGEVTLHTDTLYIQVCGITAPYGNILYRTCKGRKDYKGGSNRWASVDTLADTYAFADTLKSL